jgi:hypothetical protein
MAFAYRGPIVGAHAARDKTTAAQTGAGGILAAAIVLRGDAYAANLRFAELRQRRVRRMHVLQVGLLLFAQAEPGAGQEIIEDCVIDFHGSILLVIHH